MVIYIITIFVPCRRETKFKSKIFIFSFDEEKINENIKLLIFNRFSRLSSRPRN